jgi:hypothetical protein
MASGHKPQTWAQTYINDDGFRSLRMTNWAILRSIYSVKHSILSRIEAPFVTTLSKSTMLLSSISLACLIQGILAQTTIITGENNKNCPGVLNNPPDNKAYCCIGGELDLSTCEGWPICTGSSWEPKSMSCYTTIPVSASDYDSRVKSASSKYLNGAEASATDDASSATSTGGNAKHTVSKTTARGSAEQTASETGSAPSSSQAGNDSNMKTPGSVGGMLGSIMAMWIVL